MQAEDIWPMQSTHPGMCPRCNMPLTRRGTLQPQYAMVMCPYCGFSAPSASVSGQQQVEMPALNTLAGSQVALAPQPSAGSSVWIDPAVSVFLGGHVVDAGLPVPRTEFSYPKRVSPAPLELGPRKPQPNPITPIPPSAPVIPSARSGWPGNAMKVRPKYPRFQLQPMQEHDVTRMPTVPPPLMWQYESPDFEVESSLSALSLVVDAPTHPEPTFSPMPTRGLSQVGQGRLNLANEDTDPSSWTAGGSSASAYARRIAERGRKARKLKSNTTFNALDHLRWWLLHPGRLEFILWITGTILLVSVTFVLLLVTALNFTQFAPNLQIGHGTVLDGSNSNSNSSSSSSSGSGTHPGGTGKPIVVTTPSGLTLILLDAGPLVPGQAIQLQGKGFSPQGSVTFTDEQNEPMLILNSQSNSVQADEHGAFIVTVNDASWTPGRHLIVVRDITTARVVELPVVLAPGPFGNKNITPTPGSSTPQPGLTPTPTQNNGSGAIPTPVNFTPVPTRPVANTPTPSPKPTQAPTPTPTVGVTPTPTPGITPTVGDTPSPTTGPAQGSIDPRLMAANIGSTSLPANSNLDAAWLWLLLTGYSISMLMLGMAGILRKRRG